MNEITRTPLCWPDAVPRTAPHRRGNPRFDERTLSQSADFVFAEIDRLNQVARGYTMKSSVIISSNLKLKSDGSPYSGQGEPPDTGIAVYFTLCIQRNGKRIERPIVMSCDKWRRTADNLYAIAKDIEAQRARDRWGCTNYEQAFRGYLAIPERCGGAAWWDVLGIKPNDGREAVEYAFKRKSKQAHPDAGGSHEAFTKLTEAYDQAMAQFREGVAA